MHKYILFVTLIVFVACVAILASHDILKSNEQTAAVQSATGKAGEASVYPNPALTLGDVLTTDASVVCVSGYASSVRNVPVSLKKAVYAAYGVPYPDPKGSYEADHFISLELGGSNSQQNLWPEPASPTPGFHEKDKVENYLHQQVCSGAMSLTEAQSKIRTDWYALYLKFK